MKTKLIKLGLYSNNLIILKNIYQKIHYVILIIFHRLQHLYENRMELYNSYLQFMYEKSLFQQIFQYS